MRCPPLELAPTFFALYRLVPDSFLTEELLAVLVWQQYTPGLARALSKFPSLVNSQTLAGYYCAPFPHGVPTDC